MSKEGIFDPLRPRLIRIAYRMLGSVADAEDVVQEAFLRWMDVDRDAVREPEGYLRRVVTRLCLDHLKSARHRREPTSARRARAFRCPRNTACRSLLRSLQPPAAATYNSCDRSWRPMSPRMPMAAARRRHPSNRLSGSITSSRFMLRWRVSLLRRGRG